MTDSLPKRLGSLKKKIRVAIIGAGAMGKGLFHQCRITPGIQCVGIADLLTEKARFCAEEAKMPHRIIRNLKETEEAIRQGEVAVSENGEWLAQSGQVDVLIEASGSIGPGGKFAVVALEHEKPVILMNSEADLIFGPYLADLARKKGVVCTSCDGDQYGVLKRMIDEIEFWGFELVMAGNIKGFLDRNANPTSIIPEADKRGLDYKMCAAMTDGTKLNIEMALIANALNLSTLVPGMKGPPARHVSEVFTLFDLPTLWKERRPFVDYLLGSEPNGGVFIIAYCEDKFQKEMLRYYKMGDGPFYLLYRPYHLCHIEAMRTVAEAFLEKRTLLEPRFGFRTNVYAYAKRDLQEGESLDGLGGYACYGLIENSQDNGENPGLPVCLAENVTLKRSVKKDEKIGMKDVSYNSRNFEFETYFKALEVSRRTSLV